MDEVVVRVAAVAVMVAAALAAAGVARSGRPVMRRRGEFPGLGPGLVLFTSDGCRSCDRAEEVVAKAAGGRHRRARWEDEPETFRRYRVERVPTIVWVGEAGRGWRLHGVPTPARLRRWLAEADGP